MKILKLDESCISNPKSEISNWTGDPPETLRLSNSIFRISDLRCRIRPISKSLSGDRRSFVKPINPERLADPVNGLVLSPCRIERSQAGEMVGADNVHAGERRLVEERSP